MLQDPPFRIITNEVDYFTDGSMILNKESNTINSSAGYIKFNGQYVYGEFVPTNGSIHTSEAIALNMVLNDIEKYGDNMTRYSINTDSNALVDYLKSGRNRDKQFREIANIGRQKLEDLKSSRLIDINIVKSHCNPQEQRIYFKRHNKKEISYERSCNICNGNNAIDCFVRGNAYTGNEFPTTYGTMC